MPFQDALRTVQELTRSLETLAALGALLARHGFEMIEDIGTDSPIFLLAARRP
jgi:hypothetical protein